MTLWFRSIFLIVLGLTLWQLGVSASHLPAYFLPGPMAVFQSLWLNALLISQEAFVTLMEMALGFALATVVGVWSAISLSYCRPLRLGLLPVLVFSQAIPTFAIAPLLVLWLGYGLSSKIAITMLMLFFPIMSAFLDGLLMPRPGLMNMASLMTQSKWRILVNIQIPSALPKLATGLRVAAAGAPLAAIIGEWVGANRGLGYLLLEANARLQMDLVFAILFVLVVLSLLVYYSIDEVLKRWITW